VTIKCVVYHAPIRTILFRNCSFREDKAYCARHLHAHGHAGLTSVYIQCNFGLRVSRHVERPVEHGAVARAEVAQTLQLKSISCRMWNRLKPYGGPLELLRRTYWETIRLLLYKHSRRYQPIPRVLLCLRLSGTQLTNCWSSSTAHRVVKAGKVQCEPMLSSLYGRSQY
jgi:hypothetical protein